MTREELINKIRNNRSFDLRASEFYEPLDISDETIKDMADDFYYLLIDVLNYLAGKEEPVSIDFEQELYKAFGQVKDFTLGMRIAKWFYDMGKNSQEPVSEELEKAAEQDVCEVVNTCSATGIPNDHIPSWVQDAMINEFIHGAKWQFERVKEALLSEVLPCFMHGGEADEVVAKLDEVLNFQKK